ncbi:MAG: PilZ domain-containing protein [Candidatus Omnitrophica bacterium]|nr:PilZ domain-containing protein [Candidatus Omnitrophota bacterium]
MNIRMRQEENVVVLYLEGKIDINSANFIETTGQLVRNGHLKILCNFKSVDMVDYNGLSIMAIAYKNIVNKSGIMKFCNVPSHIRELFRTVRLDLVFDIYDEEEKALITFETISRIDKLYLRRRFRRLEFYHPVKYGLLTTSDEKRFTGKLLNIGGAGIFIYTKHTFPISSQLIMDVKLENAKSYALEGTVIWLSDKELQPHCYPGMGIQFANLDVAIQRDILDFIDRNVSYRSDI